MEDVSEERVGTTKTGADWDLRKKTEKKLNEIEETQSRNEFSELRSRIAQTSEWDYGKVSNSHKQIGERNEKSTLAVNFEKGIRKQYH